ncbi:MAG: ClpXP protease specificity-enhancing factor SspB [Anderseniella sp.]
MSDGEKVPEDLMRYDLLTQHALRSVVKLALQRVVRDGSRLPGEHHFFISFDTSFKGVSVSERIRAKYPEDMTIVLQHQFWNLEVFDRYFQVELSFDNIPEKLVIPFAAIKGFFDPTVQFGLQFEAGILEQETADDDKQVNEPDPSAAQELPASEGSNTNDKDAPVKASNDDTTVVSLDAFRKK